MAITFPIDIPVNDCIRKIEFNPIYSHTSGLTRGGKVQTAELAPTLWGVKVTTNSMIDANYDTWVSWLDALKNGIRVFKLYDVSRIRPRAYLNGFAHGTRALGGAFNGTCQISTVNALDAHEVTLHTLPNAFVFSPRDYIAFTHTSGTKRALHRVSYAGATANSNGFVTLNVEPAISPGWAVDNTVDLYKPYGLFQLVPDKTNYGYLQPGTAGQSIEFEATQTLWLP